MLNGLFSTIVSDFNESSYYVTEAEVMEEMEKLDMLNGYSIPKYFHNIDNPYDACYESMLINQQNYHNIISSIAVMEMQYLQNNNQIIYEEVISNIFDKLRDFLNAAWEKLKSIYDNVIDLFRSRGGVGGGGGSSSKNSTTSNEKSLPKSVTLNDAYDIDHKDISTVEPYKELSTTVHTIIKDTFDFGNKKSKEINKMKESNKAKTTKESASKFLFKTAYGCEDKLEFAENIEKGIGIYEKKDKITLTTEEIKLCLKNNSKNIETITRVSEESKKSIAITKQSVEKAKSACKSNNYIKRNGFSFLIEICNVSVVILNILQSKQIKACKIYESQCRQAAKQIGLI